jgi:RNA polymerase sigma-70 factor (ECF subfamily)
LQEEQLQACIEKTLLLLSPQQKAAFTLRDIEQQPLGEICNILDTSNSNIRVLLHRARLKLMQVVDRYRETGKC